MFRREPGLKPLLLEPLVWGEACELRARAGASCRSGGCRSGCGRPGACAQTADPARSARPSGLYLPAYAHETGELGLPDPAEAGRIYCLMLRHYGETFGAHLLSRLHARGEGVAFSPALAGHFARLALGWNGDADLARRASGRLRAPRPGARRSVDSRPSPEAEAWRQRVRRCRHASATPCSAASRRRGPDRAATWCFVRRSSLSPMMRF
ncbi:MAG: hypothetical protein U5L06_14740 [Rhodovibrio sp.]|nr:hypothetical protein [Rhodovibrio sp.]